MCSPLLGFSGTFLFFSPQAFTLVSFGREELVLCGLRGSFQNQKTFHCTWKRLLLNARMELLTAKLNVYHFWMKLSFGWRVGNAGTGQTCRCSYCYILDKLGIKTQGDGVSLFFSLFLHCFFMVVWNASLTLISEETVVHNALLWPFCFCKTEVERSLGTHVKKVWKFVVGWVKSWNLNSKWFSTWCVCAAGGGWQGAHTPPGTKAGSCALWMWWWWEDFQSSKSEGGWLRFGYICIFNV